MYINVNLNNTCGVYAHNKSVQMRTYNQEGDLHIYRKYMDCLALPTTSPPPGALSPLNTVSQSTGLQQKNYYQCVSTLN